MANRRGQQTEDLSNVEFETSEDVEVIPTFNSMNLREELLRGIYAYGECLFYMSCLGVVLKITILEPILACPKFTLNEISV